jgi:hypothetical protein
MGSIRRPGPLSLPATNVFTPKTSCDELVPHANSVDAGENHPLALQTRNDSNLASLLLTTVEAVSDDDGWARLSKVSPLLTKKYPDFDPRTYGYHKLSYLTTASSFLFVRDKRRKPKDPA